MQKQHVMRRGFRDIENHVSDVFWVLSKHFKYLFVSGGCMRLTGLSPEETITRGIINAHPKHSVEFIFEKLQELIGMLDPAIKKQDIVKRFPMDIRHKNGGIIHCEIVCKAVVRKGKIMYYKGLTRDISCHVKSKEQESLLQLTRRLSNEFSQPLMAIDGLVAIMKSSAESSILTLDSAKGYIDRLNIQLDRARKMVQDAQNLLYIKEIKTIG